MKLINLTIHRNNAPILAEGPPSFRPTIPESAINLTFAIQFDDEAQALSFTSNVLKTIDHFRNK